MKKILSLVILFLSTHIYSSSTDVPEALSYPFFLPTLQYNYDALKPYIDAKTMRTHVTKHHQGYINKLNAALSSYPEFHTLTLEQLLKKARTITNRSLQRAITNNGGGHYNHTLFWNMMSPKKTTPQGILLEMLIAQFGSVEQFKDQFTKEAVSLFGSGWTWLCIDADKKLVILNTPNQDTPLTDDLFPLLCLDIWEHAYYLKYQNKRDAYIQAWWHVVHWPYVAQRLAYALDNR